MRRETLGRRAFLGATGGAAGAAALGLSGCAAVSRGAGTTGRALTAIELGAHLNRLDGLLDAATTIPFITDFVRERDGEPGPELAGYLARADEHTQRAVRSLTVTSMVRDLPEQNLRAPEVQGRIGQLAPEMDRAILQTAHLISACPDEELHDIEGVLREDPTMAMRACEMVDRQGSENGLGPSERRRLRVLGRRVTNYLRDEPLSSLVDQCQQVVAEAIVHHGSVLDGATQSRLAAEAVAFWTPHTTSMRASVKSPEEGEGADPRASHLPCIEPTTEGYTVTGRCTPGAGGGSPRRVQPELDEEERLDLEYSHWRANRHRDPSRRPDASSQDRRLIRSGSSLVGVGTGLLIIGGATIPFTDGITAFLITIGGVVLIVGIILLAIGGSRRAARRRGDF